MEFHLSATRSGNYFVGHAAGSESARHLSSKDLLRKSQVYATRFIESFQLIGCERKLETCEVVLKLRQLSRAYDRNYGD